MSLDSYIIYISNVSYAASEKELGICYWQDKPLPGDVTRTKYEIMCYQPLIGQFLIIHKRKPVKSELELCEVQVYGGMHYFINHNLRMNALPAVADSHKLFLYPFDSFSE